MKKLKLKWVILFIIVVGVIIFLLSRIKEKPFKQIELEKNNIITNNTDVTYYDTILHIGLNELGIDSTYLIINSFEGATMGDFDLQAYILGNETQFMVYMKKSSRLKTIKFLSHELIHLKQYHEGKLIMVDDSFVIWKGETLDGINIPYKQRPWEIEAFDEQYDLYKKIKAKLYD